MKIQWLNVKLVDDRFMELTSDVKYSICAMYIKMWAKVSLAPKNEDGLELVQVATN